MCLFSRYYFCPLRDFHLLFINLTLFRCSEWQHRARISYCTLHMNALNVEDQTEAVANGAGPVGDCAARDVGTSVPGCS